MCSDVDWREYAKIQKFQDTPDDLLDKLIDIDRRDDKTTDNRVSELAIEHAARRVSLIKKSRRSRIYNQKEETGDKDFRVF